MPWESIFALSFLVCKHSASSSLVNPYSLVGPCYYFVLPGVIYHVPCVGRFAVPLSDSGVACHRVFFSFQFGGLHSGAFSFLFGVEHVDHWEET
jgi:hypothetical protein